MTGDYHQHHDREDPAPAPDGGGMERGHGNLSHGGCPGCNDLIGSLRARVALLERVIAILAWRTPGGLAIYDSDQVLLPDGVELRTWREEDLRVTRWKASVR